MWDSRKANKSASDSQSEPEPSPTVDIIDNNDMEEGQLDPPISANTVEDEGMETGEDSDSGPPPRSEKPSSKPNTNREIPSYSRSRSPPRNSRPDPPLYPSRPRRWNTNSRQDTDSLRYDDPPNDRIDQKEPRFARDRRELYPAPGDRSRYSPPPRASRGRMTPPPEYRRRYSNPPYRNRSPPRRHERDSDDSRMDISSDDPGYRPKQRRPPSEAEEDRTPRGPSQSGRNQTTLEESPHPGIASLNAQSQPIIDSIMLTDLLSHVTAFSQSSPIKQAPPRQPSQETPIPEPPLAGPSMPQPSHAPSMSLSTRSFSEPTPIAVSSTLPAPSSSSMIATLSSSIIVSSPNPNRSNNPPRAPRSYRPQSVVVPTPIILPPELQGLSSLPDDPATLIDYLTRDKSAAPTWAAIASEYGGAEMFDNAELIAERGVDALSTWPAPAPASSKPLLLFLANLQTRRAKSAPNRQVADVHLLKAAEWIDKAQSIAGESLEGFRMRLLGKDWENILASTKLDVKTKLESSATPSTQVTEDSNIRLLEAERTALRLANSRLKAEQSGRRHAEDQLAAAEEARRRAEEKLKTSETSLREAQDNLSSEKKTWREERERMVVSIKEERRRADLAEEERDRWILIITEERNAKRRAEDAELVERKARRRIEDKLWSLGVQ